MRRQASFVRDGIPGPNALVPRFCTLLARFCHTRRKASFVRMAFPGQMHFCLAFVRFSRNIRESEICGISRQRAYTARKSEISERLWHMRACARRYEAFRDLLSDQKGRGFVCSNEIRDHRIRRASSAVWGPEQSHKSRVDGDYITHLSDTIVAVLLLTVNACVTAMQAACSTDSETDTSFRSAMKSPCNHRCICPSHPSQTFTHWHHYDLTVHAY